MSSENDVNLRRKRRALVGSALAAYGEFVLYTNHIDHSDPRSLGLAYVTAGCGAMLDAVGRDPISGDTNMKFGLKRIGAYAVGIIGSFAVARGLSADQATIVGAAELAATTSILGIKHLRRTHRHN